MVDDRENLSGVTQQPLSLNACVKHLILILVACLLRVAFAEVNVFLIFFCLILCFHPMEL